MNERESWEKILEAIRIGHERRDAIRLARVPAETYKEWLAKAKNNVEPYAAWFQEAKEAESDAVDGYVGRLAKLSKAGNVQATRLMLQALRPERFREKPTQVNVNTTTNVTPGEPEQLSSGEAKERLYAYALQLFRDPTYYKRLQADLSGPKLTQNAGVLDGEFEET